MGLSTKGNKQHPTDRTNAASLQQQVEPHHRGAMGAVATVGALVAIQVEAPDRHRLPSMTRALADEGQYPSASVTTSGTPV